MAKTDIKLPNIRKQFVPDPGYTIYDADLAGADAQVVAWEAEDEDLKAAFRAGLDVHDHNAEAMFGTRYTSLVGEASRSGTPKGKFRKLNKQGVHLTNYGGSARTMATVLGWTVKESEDFQRRWFSIHPGILSWQRRVEHSLVTTRSVENAFGFRITYFDRIDAILPQALAWIPQSTVALVTYYGFLQLQDRHPHARPTQDRPSYFEELLQVHDSFVFQKPDTYYCSDLQIRNDLAIPVPYDDPLIIPWGLAKSNKSWGECQEITFKEAA